jgi:hypothetical protein
MSLSVLLVVGERYSLSQNVAKQLGACREHRFFVHASRPAPRPLGALRAWSPHILCSGSPGSAVRLGAGPPYAQRPGRPALCLSSAFRPSCWAGACSVAPGAKNSLLHSFYEPCSTIFSVDYFLSRVSSLVPDHSPLSSASTICSPHLQACVRQDWSGAQERGAGRPRRQASGRSGTEAKGPSPKGGPTRAQRGKRPNRLSSLERI